MVNEKESGSFVGLMFWRVAPEAILGGAGTDVLYWLKCAVEKVFIKVKRGKHESLAEQKEQHAGVKRNVLKQEKTPNLFKLY